MTLLPDIEDTGPTLRELLDRGPLTIGLALEIALQILRDPDDLHALTPDTLRLVRDIDGSPRVQRIDSETATNAEELEAPSDIHAFGVLLYELLTAVHPFQGRTSPAPLSFQVSDRQRRLPPELRTIVLTAIAEDPDGRFQSAPALGAELSKIQQRYPLDEATREAATTVRPPRQSRGTRLPAHPYGPPARSILPRLLALGIMLAVLLLLWTLLERPDEPRLASAAGVDQAEAPAKLAEAVEAEAEPAAETGTPEPVDLPSDSPAVRTEPVPGPPRQARVEAPRPSPARQQPKRSAPPPKPRTRVAGGAEFFASESAIPLSAPTPRYPDEARGTDTWAEIVVGLTVDETGAVRNPTIEKSRILGSAPASLFYEAALAAARETRYRPAREQGAPVRSWTTLTFTFGPP